MPGVPQRKKAPGSDLFSAESCPSSIVGAEVFHFRVRNGNGWAHLAIATAVPLSEVGFYYDTDGGARVCTDR